MTGSAFFVGGTNASGAGVRSIDKVSELGSCRTPLEIPEPRKEHSAVRAGRFLVICGGLVEMDNSTLSDSSNNSNSTAPETDKFLDSRRWRMTDSCHLLDPSTGQWYQMPPVPVSVAGAAAVSVGRKIFLIGGRTEEEGPSDRVFVYDQVERGIFYGMVMVIGNYLMFWMGVGKDDVDRGAGPVHASLRPLRCQCKRGHRRYRWDELRPD